MEMLISTSNGLSLSHWALFLPHVPSLNRFQGRIARYGTPAGPLKTLLDSFGNASPINYITLPYSTTSQYGLAAPAYFIPLDRRLW